MFQITGQKKKNRAQAKPTATDVAVPTAAADPGSVDNVPPAKDAFPVGRPVFVDRDGKPQIRNYEHLPVPLPFPAEPFSTATCLAAIATHITEGGLPSDFNAAYDTRTRPSTGAGNVKLMEPELAAAASVPVSALQTPEGQRQLRSILEAVGFAIVTDVLKNEECHHVERAFGADLMSIIDPTKSASPEKLARIAEDPVHNWPLDSLSLGAKSVSDWGLPHGKAAWYCRAHPNVKATFASIFQTDRLCVGLDCLFYNPTAGHPGCNDAAESRLWPHADQNRAIRPSGEYEVYQGVLYIWPADADTSATVVWPRSHVTVYDTLMTKGNYRRHFCMLPKQEFDDFAANARRVPVPAGAMLLWNSKTVHQGWNGGARLAVPICYEPVERRSHKALQSKISCVVEGIPTTHWASLGEPHVLGDSAKPAANEDVALKHAGHSWCVDERARVKPEIFALL